MDNTVRIWDLAGNVQHSIEEFGGWVSSIKKIQSGKDSSLAIGSWDNTVGIYDAEYSRNRTLTNYDNAVTAMDVDSSGNFLFVGSKERSNQFMGIERKRRTPGKRNPLTLELPLHALSYVDKFVQYVFRWNFRKDLEFMMLPLAEPLLSTLRLETRLAFPLRGMPARTISLLDALMEKLEFSESMMLKRIFGGNYFILNKLNKFNKLFDEENVGNKKIKEIENKEFKSLKKDVVVIEIFEDVKVIIQLLMFKRIKIIILNNIWITIKIKLKILKKIVR
jgi:hypothetical protein